MNKVNLPVLKAWNRTFELLEAISQNPYDRRGFENAVLSMYPGKSAKSVFRGMAIPTLRNLGLIVGYNDVIRISANGAMIHAADQHPHAEGLRALRCVLFEMDEGEVGILSYLADGVMAHMTSLVNDWIPRVEISDPRVARKPEARERAARERIQDWIDFLAHAELLHRDSQYVAINLERYEQAKFDADSSDDKKKQLFKSLFFESYVTITDRRAKTRTVDLEVLRQEVALDAFSTAAMLISEMQFDSLLSALPKTSQTYTISFGRSMGAGEKLFRYNDNYYQSISIRFEDRSQLESTS